MNSPTKRAHALALCLLLAALGACAGAWIGGRFFAPGPGVDALASMLSGLSVGAIAGGIAGALLARALDARALRTATWIALAMLFLCFAFVFLLRPRDGTAEPERESPTHQTVAPAADGE